MSGPQRGDVWWGETPERKGRPYLVLTRDEAIPVLRSIVVAPVTRTVRGIESELAMGRAEGLSVDCAASFDSLATFPKGMLTRRLGRLAESRTHEMCAALTSAFNC